LAASSFIDFVSAARKEALSGSDCEKPTLTPLKSVTAGYPSLAAVQPSPGGVEPEDPGAEEEGAIADDDGAIADDDGAIADDDGAIADDDAMAELAAEGAGAAGAAELELLELVEEPEAAGVLLLQPASARLKATATASVFPVRLRCAVMEVTSL